MGKNIIICCDGTNNEFGKRNTNVVRLYQCLSLGPQSGQVAFYDPGIGTLAAPQMLTRIGKTFSRLTSSAFGTGILANVEDVMRFLMVHYEPGDQVFMFGFSRGSYTARMAAGMLRKCGLPSLGNEGLLPYVKRLYRVRFGDNSHASSDASSEFKQTFGTRSPVRFLGLWDTVSTVGTVWNPESFPYTFRNDEVEIIRHALAVDERRGFFRTNRWGPALPLTHTSGIDQNVAQLRFPGVHSDVGGGYPDGELWKHPFAWMAHEAKVAGMKVDDAKIDLLLGSNLADWHRSTQHESLTLPWRLAGVIPKKVKVEKDGAWETQWRLCWPKRRAVRQGEHLDGSVIERWKDSGDYRPPNLDPGIMARLVPQLTPATVSLPYA